MKQVKDYLNQLKYLDADINSRLEELNQIRQSLTSVSAVAIKEDPVQSSRKGHYDEKYLKMFDVEDGITTKIDELINLRGEISNQIDKVNNQMYSIILRERYLNMKEFHEISELLSRSDSWTLTLHGKALIAFYHANIDLFKNNSKQ